MQNNVEGPYIPKFCYGSESPMCLLKMTIKIHNALENLAFAVETQASAAILNEASRKSCNIGYVYASSMVSLGVLSRSICKPESNYSHYASDYTA